MIVDRTGIMMPDYLERNKSANILIKCIHVEKTKLLPSFEAIVMFL